MYKVYLSPTSNNNEVGKKEFGFEAYRMRQIAEVIEERLLNKTHIIVFKNMEGLSIEEIIEDSNHAKPDVYIGLHTRTGNKKGIEIFVNENNMLSNSLGREIHKKLKKTHYEEEKNAIKYTSNKKEVVKSMSPSVAIYLGSRDNLQDVNWIINNKRKIGEAIAEGIEEYFKLKKC